MKRAFVCIATVLVVFGQLCAQEGLVAYYPFNGSADDQSGLDNHGIVSGATLTSDRFEHPDSAYRFDGIDDHIDIPFDSSLYPSSITVSAWINTDTIPSAGAFILTNAGDIHTPPYDPFRLWLKTSGKISSRYEGDMDSVRLILKSTTVMTPGRWYFVATSFDEFSGAASLYINGIREDSLNAQMQLDRNTLGFRIGANQNFNGTSTDSSYFCGMIDDVRLYNRALTARQIKTLYEQTRPDDIVTPSLPVGENFVLYQNYPNPFNPTTTLRYYLSTADRVVLKIYNTLGQLVKTLVDEPQAAGEHSLTWDGTDERGQTTSAGLYLYSLEVGKETRVKKMLFLK